MSESAAKPEPHPFQKFTEFARRIVSVPKEQADQADRKIREDRAKTRKPPAEK